MSDDPELAFCEILMTGTIMGALMVSEFDRDYDYECVGYPDPGASNVIEIVNKHTGALYRVTVECLGMTVPK